MRPLFLIMVAFCLSWTAAAQAPDWSVDASQYNYSMVMVGLIKVDGWETSNAGDKLGAFINGEVRGVASPVFQENLNRNMFYLIIYHHENGGTITFKYYDAAANTVTTSAQTAIFTVDGLMGDANKPMVWSNRPTHTEAALLTFRVPGQLGSHVYDDSVTVRVNTGTGLPHQAADFTLSEAAGLYVNNRRQKPGETLVDFNVPMTLVVRSEDEQTIREYPLHFRESSNDIPNILFPNGAPQNRTWGVSHLGVGGPVTVQVFDRQGHLVFAATDPQQEWDGLSHGKQVPEGTYFYSVELGDEGRLQGVIQVIY